MERPELIWNFVDAWWSNIYSFDLISLTWWDLFTVPRYEAVELRDGDKGMYLGNSVAKAVKNINEKISEALIGMDPKLQAQIDQAMTDLDKTEKKVGGNSVASYIVNKKMLWFCIFSWRFVILIISQNELGANAILAVSIAACKAGAAEKEVSTSSRRSIFSYSMYFVLTI